MIPPLKNFIAGFDFLARRYGLTERPLVDELAAVHGVATWLAETDPLSEPAVEPAALFYAVARQPKVMGDVTVPFARRLARNQAASVGLVLVASDDELDALRLRIHLERLPFEAVRDWFRARIRPAAL